MNPCRRLSAGPAGGFRSVFALLGTGWKLALRLDDAARLVVDDVGVGTRGGEIGRAQQLLLASLQPLRDAIAHSGIREITLARRLLRDLEDDGVRAAFAGDPRAADRHLER